MPVILAVETALPQHAYPQGDITEALASAMHLSPPATRLLGAAHAQSGIDTRHLALDLSRYGRLRDFTESNALWVDEGLDLLESAAKSALAKAGLSASDIDLVMFVSVTGISAPSLDARLIPRLGLRRDVKRVPIFGLGCVAGASGLARLSESLTDRSPVGLLLSLELCSLTVQVDDHSRANMVGTGLFGDGACAVVMTAQSHAGFQVLDSQARVYPHSEDALGWEVGSFGFRIVLSASLSALVRQHIGEEVDTMLARNGLQRSDVHHWIAHTGGPKVMTAIEQALDLSPQHLRHTYDSLRECGNLSSASVLDVLRRTIDHEQPDDGDVAVLMAMGPGFSSECVLLRWRE